MRDEDKNYRTMKQIIKDSTDRELERYETKGLTPDELKTMVAAAKRKKKQRYRKLAGVAALFVVVLFGAIIVFNNFSTDVEADKNAKEEIITEDGVVIEDGGWGGSETNVWEITEWDEIASAQMAIPQLIVPEYTPKQYKFQKLTIQSTENTIDAEYLFNDTDENCLVIHEYIQNEGLEATFIKDSERIVNSNKGDIYIKNDLENNYAIIQMSDSVIIQIWSNLTENDMIKIIEHIKC